MVYDRFTILINAFKRSQGAIHNFHYTCFGSHGREQIE